MTRVLKTFLLWLLMAALPLQGMAAVVNANCGPNHHSSSVVMHDTGAHHHDDSSAHHHGDTEAAAASADSASDTENMPQASSCSACAACCAGATAPPSSLGLATALRIPEAVVSASAAAFIGHIPASLDRPPQRSLV